mmetsp:Transcript_120236/g.285690  ORF Transcript_120236/g.285690 Transcript_120236/m.285690 type:complete len:229 (+) Transcript_120236:65-751(+)
MPKADGCLPRSSEGDHKVLGVRHERAMFVCVGLHWNLRLLWDVVVSRPVGRTWGLWLGFLCNGHQQLLQLVQLCIALFRDGHLQLSKQHRQKLRLQVTFICQAGQRLEPISQPRCRAFHATEMSKARLLKVLVVLCTHLLLNPVVQAGAHIGQLHLGLPLQCPGVCSRVPSQGAHHRILVFLLPGEPGGATAIAVARDIHCELRLRRPSEVSEAPQETAWVLGVFLRK